MQEHIIEVSLQNYPLEFRLMMIYTWYHGDEDIDSLSVVSEDVYQIVHGRYGLVEDPFGWCDALGHVTWELDPELCRFRTPLWEEHLARTRSS